MIWEQHPERDRYEKDVFQVFFREALESGGAFVVIDRSSQQIIGSTRFYGYDPEKSEIEIGWTFLARKYWGGRYNAETAARAYGNHPPALNVKYVIQKRDTLRLEAKG